MADAKRYDDWGAELDEERVTNEERGGAPRDEPMLDARTLRLLHLTVLVRDARRLRASRKS